MPIGFDYDLPDDDAIYERNVAAQAFRDWKRIVREKKSVRSWNESVQKEKERGWQRHKDERFAELRENGVPAWKARLIAYGKLVCQRNRRL